MGLASKLKAESSHTGSASTAQPPVQQPAVQQTYQQPAVQQPYQQPAVQQTYQQPAVQQPYQQPAVQQQYQQPAVQQPYQQPAVQQPYQQTATQQPYQQTATQQPLYPTGGMTRTTVTSDMSQLLWNKLEQTVRDNNLEKFYTPERLRQVHNLVQSVNWDSLAQRWKISKELAMDFAALALYDIVLYIDDSGSMAVEEGGDRIEDAKLYCSKISEIATLFDDDGILVRFINSNIEGNGIRNANEVNNLFSQIRFSGGTALGTMLEQKIIRPLVTSQTTLNKPILVVTITDGEPSGEPKNKLEVVISETVRFCDKKYGRHAVSFMFAQVGKDMRAQQFLSEIDENKYFGDVVDTVSYYELESMKLEKHGITLTPETFLLKLILGAVDKSYDMDV